MILESRDFLGTQAVVRQPHRGKRRAPKAASITCVCIYIYIYLFIYLSIHLSISLSLSIYLSLSLSLYIASVSLDGPWMASLVASACNRSF